MSSDPGSDLCTKLLAECRYGNAALYQIKLGGGQPSSIRDQIRRAVEFIDCASGNLIGTGRPLLVIGAGAAGVAAAFRAAQANIEVTLRDGSKQPFSTQARCTTRWVHPYQYDWPSQNFRDPACPAGHESHYPHLLRWEEKRASEIAADWIKQFEEGRATLKREGNATLQWRGGLPVQLPTLCPEEDTAAYTALHEAVNPKIANESDERRFGAVLFCVGAHEDHRFDDYCSFQFWQNDPYEDENLGLDGERNQPWQILVSGAGDGALQDFLRVVCRKGDRPFAAYRLVDRLPELNRSPSFMARLATWQTGSDENRPAGEVLWDEMSYLLTAISAEIDLEALDSNIEALIKPEFLDGRKRITLAYRNYWFSRSYLLNALLVRLIVWYLSRNSHGVVLRPNVEIRSVKRINPLSGTNRDGDPENCLRHRYKVEFSTRKVPRERGSESNPDTSADMIAQDQETPISVFDLLIIRHGVQPKMR